MSNMRQRYCHMDVKNEGLSAICQHFLQNTYLILHRGRSVGSIGYYYEVSSFSCARNKEIAQAADGQVWLHAAGAS